MGTRNFGIGSRDMAKAGAFVLNAAARKGAVSFSTAATTADRWSQFSSWAKEHAGVKQMEKIDSGLVVAYGESLQEKVSDDEMSAATAQNYISAINTVMTMATEGKWESVSPTRDCGIAHRSGIASKNKSISQAEHDRLTSAVSDRLGNLLNLQRSLGLRFEESAKINAGKALEQAQETGRVIIEAGTKGGLKRTVPASPEAVAALVQAAEIQGKNCSMIPTSDSYRDFQRAAYRELREAGGYGFHCERHTYAQERYKAFTGAPSPVATGWTREERIQRLADALGVSKDEAKKADERARLIVANELGHGRIEVTNAYLG